MSCRAPSLLRIMCESSRKPGWGEDVAYCARLDVSGVVPMLQRDEDGLLVVRPRSRLPQT